MRKLLCGVIAALLLLCGCSEVESPMEEQRNTDASNTVGVWITAFELNAMFKSEAGFKQEFVAALEGLEDKGVNCLYVHTRAFADAYYPSAIFPRSYDEQQISDPLEFMLSEAHLRGMRFFAWVNPYRISTSTNDKTAVNAGLLKAVGEESILATVSGLYFDPASSAARRLVIDGVREIVKGYNVDGIHFDDYFYPTAEPSFDEVSYGAYKGKAATPLTLEDWRRANVNTLISGTYGAIKAINNKVLFSISPAADIKGNFSDLFADVRAWCDGGYADEIIPQLYFGFEYPIEGFRFDKLLSSWQEYLKGCKVRLLIGLPCYKRYERNGADEPEWSKYDDIIPRQIAHIKENASEAGYVYFSYSSLKK